MSRSRWIVLVLLGVTAVAVVTVLVRNGRGNQPAYRFEEVDRGDIQVAISATGTVNAVTNVLVGSQVSGTIAKIFVDFNDRVTEGQVLAQLDPTFLQATVREQQANVERAQAQVNDARRTLTRTQELFKQSFVSQADLDGATTAVESAEATLRQSEASLERAQVNLRYATIKTPISGVVVSRNVDVGQTVAASLQAPTLFTIANDLRKMQVQASVDEADIGGVTVGQTVSFRVDAFPEEMYGGTVSQVRLAPTVVQNVVTYQVIIDVDNPQMRLLPGMTATVSIEQDHRDEVLRVPLQALRFTPPQAQTGGARAQASDGPRAERGNGRTGTVWVLRNGVPSPQRVERGIQNSRYVELLGSELSEGDSVIVGTLGADRPQTSGTTNPFMPRMPGGGGGGRRGGM